MSIFGGGSGISGGGSGILGGGSGIAGGGSGILGGGSVVGSGFSAIDYTFASGALLTSRDGIVGDWAPPTKGWPEHHDQSDLNYLARCAPWVRAHVFDRALLQTLSVVTQSDGTARLWHRDPIRSGEQPQADPKSIFVLGRPRADKFGKQLKWVEEWANLRADRAGEILAQIPEILTFFGSIVWLRPDRMRWTMELLGTIYRATLAIEMQFKAAMACRRPIEYSAQIQPLIETPGHSAYPSGHAMESHVFAFVLACLVKYREEHGAGGPPAEQVIEQLERLAARITINRTVAGVHFPVDSEAGARLGMTLARYFVTRAKLGGTASLPDDLKGEFLGETWFANNANPDFEGIVLSEHAKGDPAKKPAAWAADAPLGWLWKRAEGEWT